jgi:hypothetical protein
MLVGGWCSDSTPDSVLHYYQPPTGPPTGALLCVPLRPDGSMQAWRVWTKHADLTRLSGVTLDHAGGWVC